MRFTKLKIKNWRNFWKPREVELANRLFIIGPNAAGKSNLLDVFRFLRDLVPPHGNFQKAVEQRGGVTSIRCLAARNDPIVAIHAGMDLDERGKWTYELEFTHGKGKLPVITREAVFFEDTNVLTRPDSSDVADPPRLTQTALEQITANKGFRDVADFFASVSYQHLVPQVVRDPKGFSPARIENDPYGRDLLQRVANTPPKFRDSRLNKILKALKIAVPQLDELRIAWDKATQTPHLVGQFVHWRKHPKPQTESQFSDGTLRLFGLLWSMFEGEGPVLLEEPELSLHSEIVRHLPQLFESVNRSRKTKRQLLISTHSEDMLRDRGIAAEEVLRLEPSKDGSQLVPTQLDEEAAKQMRAGLSAADAVLPKTRPKDAENLPLFAGLDS